MYDEILIEVDCNNLELPYFKISSLPILLIIKTEHQVLGTTVSVV